MKDAREKCKNRTFIILSASSIIIHLVLALPSMAPLTANFDISTILVPRTKYTAEEKQQFILESNEFDMETVLI